MRQVRTSERRLSAPFFEMRLMSWRASGLTFRHRGARSACRSIIEARSSYWAWDASRAPFVQRRSISTYAGSCAGCGARLGRSKTGSGAWHFKKNWGFEPEALTYSAWQAAGTAPRDADPTSARHSSRIALWRKLPLALANRLGPTISRGLG